MDDPNTVKRELRRRMRDVRRELTARDRRALDAAIVQRLVELADELVPPVVMVHDAVPGEPDVSAFADWCRSQSLAVVVPVARPAAPVPVDAGRADFVVVPGLAFDAAGRRLGQGGGWYDAFLASTRSDALVVGVCYDEQIVDAVPVEAHDVSVDVVVTPTRTRLPDVN